MINIDDMAVFCKRKGFVYPSSEIYGGMSGFFDFGPLGVEMKNNIKAEWWKKHVQERQDIVGIDGSIITNPKVWMASGHVGSFTDILLSCRKCGNKVRADHLIEEKLGVMAEGMSDEQVDETIRKNKIKCPVCNGELKSPKSFNLMFKTYAGPVEEENALSYLRPETAQHMFTDFRLVQENARMKLPFGIAQVGRVFRNEISPRDFLFRCREFEQMEIEYFVHPKKYSECPYVKEFHDYELSVLSAEMQEKSQKQKKMSVKELLDKKIIRNPWHAYWLAFEQKWFEELGANMDNFRIRQHVKNEKSHYAMDTWDLEYKFPFGWKELEGISNRTDFDLQQHMRESGKDLSIYDNDTKQKVVPHVIAEPSLGVERAFLVFMFDAYEFDKKRNNIVIKLHPKLAPVKVGVFPLVSNKPELVKKAEEVYHELRRFYVCAFDASGAIGRRYFRNDEIGTVLGCTIDFDTLKYDSVTLRHRDTTKQIRVKIRDLKDIVGKLMEGGSLDKMGDVVK